MINSPPNFGGPCIAKPRNADLPNPQNLAVESGCPETSRDSYISKLAAKFNVNIDGKLPQKPLFCEPLRPEEDYQASAQQILAYQQRVGSLNFAAAISRPDIAHGTSKLASFLRILSKRASHC